MIVVEGPDGSGKTTLCKRICEDYNLSMGERSITNRDEIWKCTREDTWKAMYHTLYYPEAPLVWDRIGPISDPIYSVLGIPHQRDCAFNFRELHVFQEFMRYMGIVIVCYPPLATVVANVEEGDQLEGVVDNTESIYREYGKLHWARYDYTTDDSLNVKALIISYLNMQKEREALCSSFGTPAT